ncbi:unnamed protein product [Dovyalis caffra]|uniref:Amino acid transporter transmembrane domain-containing protein n=1 Tax=Dovyalis caffra TaxID=77055 RepID=A0AAV1RIV1_9ROSI|nr:unnamed protein product [Dovyalis caffra]
MYYATLIFQFLTLFLLNTGFILLGGRALKDINLELGQSSLRLQYFIIIAGVACFIFAFFIPTMSAMRIWLGASTIVTSLYIAILTFTAVKDAKSNTKRNYGISGSKVDKVFNGLGAISAIIVCNTCGMIPELQSTLRRPAVQNMRKALYVQFTVGLMFYYGVSIVGYWAYGSSVSSYLPNELSCPKWVKILINTLVLLQSVISQNVRP